MKFAYVKVSCAGMLAFNVSVSVVWGEFSFEQDILVEGGRLGPMTNGTEYREVRPPFAAFLLPDTDLLTLHGEHPGRLQARPQT